MFKIQCRCGEGTNDYEWYTNSFIGGLCNNCERSIGLHVHPDGTPMDKDDPRLFRCKCGEDLCKKDFTRDLGNFTSRGDVPEYHVCVCGRVYEIYDLKVKEFKGSTENLPLIIHPY